MKAQLFEHKVGRYEAMVELKGPEMPPSAGDPRRGTDGTMVKDIGQPTVI